MAIDDRLLAEQAVIGSMLIDEDCVADLLATVSVKDFQTDICREAYQAVRDLYRQGRPVDLITVRSVLGDSCTQTLRELCELTPTSANAMEYARLMHEQATLARIRETCTALTTAATLEDARPLIADLTSSVEDGQHLDIWDMRRVLDYFQQSQTVPERKKDYISLGIRELDEGTFLELGDVLVIAGEPSAGKTAFGLLTAMEMAKKHKVGFFSLETKNEKLADRLIAGNFGIDFSRIKRAALTEADWTSFASGSGDFINRNLKLIQAGGMNATQIASVTKACGYDVIFIDYAQLLAPEVSDRLGSAAQMSAISRSLHTFAQRNNVLLVELLQLSRSENKSRWREPNMHDLKETGQWEQDADIILMLYLPHPDGDYDPNTTRFLKIAKNKEGRRGNFPLRFDGNLQKFSIMTGPDVNVLLNKKRNAAKRKNPRYHGQVDGQQKLDEAKNIGQQQFVEIEEDGTEPI